MGNVADEYLKDGHEVVFAFEEAIGYMCGHIVLDKDGISAAAVMAEFAGWLEAQGKTFRQQLEELYEKSALTCIFTHPYSMLPYIHRSILPYSILPYIHISILPYSILPCTHRSILSYINIFIHQYFQPSIYPYFIHPYSHTMYIYASINLCIHVLMHAHLHTSIHHTSIPDTVGLSLRYHTSYAIPRKP